MKILITGITGFIGKHVAESLCRDHEISGICLPGESLEFFNDMSVDLFVWNGQSESLLKHLKNFSPEGIIHLASQVVNKHKYEQIESIIRANVLFPTWLLDYAVSDNVKWFINTGSYWQNFEGEVYYPVNLYAATKQALEDIAVSYYRNNSLKFVTVRLGDNYGPDDVRSKLINLWFDIADTERKLKMSPGGQKLSLHYVEDIVRAYKKMTELLSADDSRIENGGVYHLSAIEEKTLREYAEIFEKTLNVKLNIDWGAFPYREMEFMKPEFPGKPIPDWEAKVNFETGIKNIYKRKINYE